MLNYDMVPGTDPMFLDVEPGVRIVYCDSLF